MIPAVHMAFESRFKNFRSWINTELKQNKKLKRIFYFLLFFLGPHLQHVEVPR